MQQEEQDDGRRKRPHSSPHLSRPYETNLLPCSFHKNLLVRGGRLPRSEGILPLL